MCWKEMLLILKPLVDVVAAVDDDASPGRESRVHA